LTIWNIQPIALLSYIHSVGRSVHHLCSEGFTVGTVRKSSITTIATPPEAVWAQLDERFADIYLWAGGVTSSKANPAAPSGLNGSSYGGRICDIEGVGVTDERIVAFDAAERTLTYSVQADGLPFFVTGLQNTWTVRSDGGTGSEVSVEMAAFTKGLMGKVGSIPLGRMLGKAAVGLPNDLKVHLEQSA
jgi:hypothetical protein